MAIKIIKNTMTEPIQIECSNCKSIFEYNFEDIEVREASSIFSWMVPQRTRVVVCPVCKMENALERIKLQQDKEGEEDGSE